MVVRLDGLPGAYEDQLPPVVPPPLHVHTEAMLFIELPSTFWILLLVGTSGRETRFQPVTRDTLSVVTVDVPGLMVNGLGLDVVTLKPLKGLRAVILILQLGAVVVLLGLTSGHAALS